MATQRWRLTNTATNPSVTPALQGTYLSGHTAPADPLRQLLSSDSSALTNVQYLPDAADHGVAGAALHCQFVSGDLGADLVYASGSTIKAAVQGFEVNANCNQSPVLTAAIFDSAGTTLRRLLLQDYVQAASEWATALTNRFLTTTQTGASYTTVSGDILSVEIGFSGTPGGGGGVQGHNGTIRWGGDGSSGDLPENDTETGTTFNPWIEFVTDVPAAPVYPLVMARTRT